MSGFLLFSARNDAVVLRDRLTQGRLEEVWGDRYRGQTVWPDGVTTAAVSVRERPDGQEFAIPVKVKAERLLRQAERDAAVDQLPVEWGT